MPVLLIRHAHAGARKEWSGQDSLRPLSSRGRKQAKGLVKAAEEFVPQRVLSSPSTRCMETVAPLAGELSLRVEPIADLSEGQGLAAVALVRALADEKIALCTHGDVIAEVLVALADEDRLDLGRRPLQAKGSVWVLESTGGRFHRASYVAPSA